jgi:hypothetical protein
MPLCNISYSYLLAHSAEKGLVPAILGMVEDVLTTGNPSGKASYQNARLAGLPEEIGRSPGEFFLLVHGVTPLYPEVVLDCALRKNLSTSREWVATMQAIAAQVGPETIDRSLAELDRAWTRFLTQITKEMNWRPLERERPTGTYEPARPPAASLSSGVVGGVTGVSSSGSQAYESGRSALDINHHFDHSDHPDAGTGK